MAAGKPNPALVLVKLIGTLVVTGVLAAGVALPFVGGAGLAAKHEADKFLDTTCNLQETPPPQKTTVLASDGKTVIATIFKQDRQPVPLSRVPKGLQQALVATEDRRFYSHHGVDLRGLIRGAINTSSGDTQGGSTLTMQYVKQLRYYQAGDNKAAQERAIAQTLDRKMEDARCALRIEGTLHESKDTILDNYLNIAFFGENSYGVETAARTYFDKSVSQLTLPESAMLVGILRAPTSYDPFQHPEAARERRDQVLQNMVTAGNLTQAAADRYKSTPIPLATTAAPPLKEGCASSESSIVNVGYFCDYAVDWLLNTKAVTETQLQTGGLRIVTTLDAQMQNRMQAGLKRSLSSSAAMSAVMPALDPRNGHILAMATSRPYGAKSGQTTLPIFTSYTAQGASTYKLFPLLTALSAGVQPDFELQTPSIGEHYPWQACPDTGNVTNVDSNGEDFNPGYNQNMTDAIARSSNTFFVGIADDFMTCNLQPILDMAGKLGLKGLQQPSDEARTTVEQQILKYSSATRLVLGDIPTSPLEISNAYATVANDGVYNAPSPVLSITDEHGQSIAVPHTASKQVLNPQVAREAVSLLQGDTQGTGTSAAQFAGWYQSHPDDMIAGKTGTAPGRLPNGKNYDKNGALWFVGMTPKLVATTALINLNYPSYAASHLPGVTDAPDNAFGAYAAGVWLKALRTTLGGRSWTWAPPDATGPEVPSVIGMPMQEAEQTLKGDGYKVAYFVGTSDFSCPSNDVKTAGDIAYQSPTNADRGATITLCPASGVSQTLYVPPPPKPVVRHNGNHRNGGNNNGGGRGNGTGNGGSGNGGGTGGGSGGGAGGGNGNGGGGGNGGGNGGGAGGGNGGGGNPQPGPGGG